ncbi:DUF6790 family protein [Actinomycetospora sp. C-140]
MGFFAFQWAVVIVGFGLHAVLDRSAHRRTGGRVAELAALWLIVVMGAFNIFGGVFHAGPTSSDIAAQIGYAPSMFQWEVGWADIAVGVAMVAVAMRRFRGSWATATLTILFVYFVGDGIGHIMSLVAHGNTAPDNIAALPADFLLPVLAFVLVGLARRAGFFTDRALTAADVAVPAAVRV